MLWSQSVNHFRIYLFCRLMYVPSFIAWIETDCNAGLLNCLLNIKFLWQYRYIFLVNLNGQLLEVSHNTKKKTVSFVFCNLNFFYSIQVIKNIFLKFIIKKLNSEVLLAFGRPRITLFVTTRKKLSYPVQRVQSQFVVFGLYFKLLNRAQKTIILEHPLR